MDVGREEEGGSVERDTALRSFSTQLLSPAGSDMGRLSRADIVKRLSGHLKVFGIYPRMTFWGEH